MNSLLTKKAFKINGLPCRNQARNTASAVLVTALLLSVFSTNIYANRPAMEEQEASSDVGTQAEMQPGQASIQNRPAADDDDGPSAVEIMMQQQSQQNRQTQQSGDVLQLPAKEIQPGETIKIQLLDNPRRGMSMEKVQQEFGQPIAMSESVGQPPITHWTYSDRVVYFEYSTVLHVVAR
jgi:hypothetical protein